MSVMFIPALGGWLFFFSCNKILSGKAPLNNMDMESVQSQWAKSHEGWKEEKALNEAELTAPSSEKRFP